MTFDRLDQEKFYRRVTKELFDKFTPLPTRGEGDGGTGETLITNQITEIASAIPTVIVVSYLAPAWMISAAEEAIFAGKGGWYLCDGINDEEEIQEAIESVSSFYGGRIILSSGEFYVDVPSGTETDAAITMVYGVELVGMGSDRQNNYGTAIWQSNAGAGLGSMVKMSSGGSIKNIAFYTDGDATTIWVPTEQAVIEDCYFNNDTGHQIDIDEGVSSGPIRINRCHFEPNEGDSIHVGAPTGGGGGNGNVWITNNYFEWTTDNSVYVGATEANHPVFILNNRFESDVCVRLEDSERVIIRGNNLWPFDHGIHLTDASDCIIEGNLIYEPGTNTDNTYDGILLDGDSNRNMIRGNRIIPDATTNPRYGINISASTCNDNRVGDNDYGVLADYGTHPLNDAGTDTKYPTAARAAMSVGGALSIGSGAARWPMAEAGIMIDAHATVGTAPSGGPVTVDINKNGTTMYATATNPSVGDGNNVGSKAPADQTTFAEDDYLTLDLDAVNGAEDLTCIVRYLVA